MRKIKVIREEKNTATTEDYKNVAYHLAMANAHHVQAFNIINGTMNKSSQEYKCTKSALIKTEDAISRLEISMNGKFGHYMSNDEIHEIFHPYINLMDWSNK